MIPEYYYMGQETVALSSPPTRGGVDQIFLFPFPNLSQDIYQSAYRNSKRCLEIRQALFLFTHKQFFQFWKALELII